MPRKRTRKGIVAVVAIAVILGLLYIFRFPVTQFALTKGIGAVTGTSVAVGRLSMHGGQAVVSDVRVSAHHGEQLAFLPRVVVRYDLRDLLPGSGHRFGLRSITIYRPRITVVHNPDGSYNLPHLGKGGGGPKSAAPLDFRMRVIDGSIAVIDDTRVDPAARRLRIDGVNVDAAVNTAARTQYVASMAYDDAGIRYPIDGRGTIDSTIGLNYQRWTATHVPLPQLVNYALNNANLRLRAGFLDGLDARYYGKIAATAYLRGGRVSMQGVAAPIEDVHGPLDVTSTGLSTPRLDARLAGAPIHVSGAIYDLSHPHFRLIVRASGDVARLKKLTAAAANLPVRGPIDLALLVEGAVRTPLALILTHSPEIDYRAMPLRNPNGMLAFDGHTATIVNFAVQYGGFSLGARGRMALAARHNAVEAIASVRGPSDAIPYASALFPGLAVTGTMLASGDGLKRITTRGVLAGAGPQPLAGAFDVASNGVGDVLLRYGNALVAKIALDHPHATVNALIRARDLAIRPAAAAAPGLPSRALPALSGIVTGDVFASRQRDALGLLGNVALRDVRYGKIAIAAAHARFGGAPGNVRVASLDAAGSFGRIAARGAIAGTNRIALEGRYTGSLTQIASIAGNGVPAQGAVNAPIALFYGGGRSVAQVHDARFAGASIRGIPIEGLSATIALRPSAIDVYAARARIARTASALADGSIGNGGRVAFAVSHYPVAGGYADAGATASGSLSAPRASGALLLSGARYRNYPIGGASEFTYAGGTAGVRDAMISAGPALVAVDGTVWPRYDLDAAASGLFSYSQFQGSVDANVHVAGSGAAPLISGVVDAPEGNVHGLAFRDMHANIAGTPADMTISNGSVAVGETALRFAAAIAPGDVRASIVAPQAELDDFNDYFDTGDTLAGKGSLALSVAMTPFTLASSGKVDLQGVRFRRFDIGRTIANWKTTGRSTSLVASVASAHGSARVSGTIAPKSRVLDLRARARNIDLASWLPLFGYTAPVTGYVDADAALRGAYPDVAMNANANLRDGTVGRVPIQRAQIAATAVNGRGRISQAIVQLPYFIADGSGTFGLHRTDRLQLAIRATSPNVGKLMQTFSGKPNDVGGVLNTTLNVGGTPAQPQLTDALTVERLRYAKFVIPQLQAWLNIDKRRIALTKGVVTLPKGTLTAAGDVPVKPARTSPVSLALTANGVDLSDFGAALPQGSRVAGALNGALHVGGTMQAPLLTGSMALTKGYFVGPIDQNPISGMNALLRFSGTQIALQNVHADVGGGTLDMNATASVPTLRDVRAVTFDSTIVAHNAQVNSPQYFRGKFDANVRAYRAAGGIPTIAGTVVLPSARIPLTAFWNPHAPKKPKAPPLNLAFDLTADIGHDVRVQSPNVDVGAEGSVTVAGTMQHPALSGQIASTGGTVDFFRRFTIQSAEVAFDPANGIWPEVNAVADTQISNPFTYVQLQVTGLAPNNMHLVLQSDPPYDRTQILTFLTGLQNFNGGLASAGGGTGGFTLGGAVQNMALGQLNTLFTRDLFEPLDVGLGQALGLQNLQITDDFTSGFGISAVKAFGKHITAVFAENMGEPKEQSLSIEAHHGNSTAFDLMLYNVQDPPLTGFIASNNNPFKFNLLNDNSTLMATSGTSGLSLLYEHKFH